MLNRTYDYSRSRRKQALFFVIAGAVAAVGLIVAVILFCYQSNHLRV
jgi:hypothetical protein